MILLAAEGIPNHEIAARTGCSQPTVRLWRSRFSERGIGGLEERKGRGHPFTYTEEDVARIIATTLKGPPAGSTHWSTRTMAAHLGMSASTVQRIWREHRLQPHLVSTFKYSNDPHLEAKVTDIVGLYLNPPERAIVLCIDEKTMIQALDRTQPLLPMKPGQVARHTHDYVRNGTTDLYAALDVATGNVTPQFTERHRAIEFLDFLKLVARTYPRKELHLVVDNSSSHETKEVYGWLQKHPRIHLHLTPTSSSWMNQVETWFSLLNSRAIRAAPSRMCIPSATPFSLSSTPGTMPLIPSNGSRPRTTSWPRPNGKIPVIQDTRPTTITRKKKKAGAKTVAFLS